MKKFTPLGDSLKHLVDRLPEMDALPDEDPDSRCPLCDGYGHIIDERGARPCQCVTREVLRDAFVDARIPRRFSEESLDTFRPKQSRSLRMFLNFARKYVENYSENNSKGLYICGSTGIGKTHLAIGVLKALMAKGHPGVFYNLVDLFDAIRASYDPQKPPAASQARIAELLDRQVLVLDDFGMGKSTSWATDRLYAMINRRYQECKTLILTSNLSLKALRQRVEPALYSRIMSLCTPVEITGEDFRNPTPEEIEG